MDEFAILCILAAAGIIWGATATYLIRVRDYALQTETSFRSRYSCIDHVVEIIVAGFVGFIGGILAHSAGANPPLIVLSASLGSFVNRSAVALTVKYAPILADKYTAKMQTDETRLQKIEMLERAKILETRVEERIRIQAMIDELRQDLKG